MALTISSLLAVPDGPALSLEDHALYSTELFGGDLPLMEGNDLKTSSNQPLDNTSNFLPNSDLWNSEWSMLPTATPSATDIPDLSLLCDSGVDFSFLMATPFPPSPDTPAPVDVYPLSSPVSSPTLSPVLSPEEQIQSIISYLEDDTPSSVESATSHAPIYSPATPTLSPIASPIANTTSPSTTATVPQKRVHIIDDESDESLSFKPPSKKKTPLQKKLRKKEQNKTAALRYRQRKKEELDELEGKEQALSETNKELKNQVNGLEAEIKYLKQLWVDVSRARLATNAK